MNSKGKVVTRFKRTKTLEECIRDMVEPKISKVKVYTRRELEKYAKERGLRVTDKKVKK